MHEDVIADLKQFIARAITQQTSDIRLDISDIRQDMSGIKQDVSGIKDDISGLKHDVQQLDKRVGSLGMKVDNGFSGIAEILEDMNSRNDVSGTHLKDHERRVTRLEQHAV
jgi:archaellum component FlaC